LRLRSRGDRNVHEQRIIAARLIKDVVVALAADVLADGIP